MYTPEQVREIADKACRYDNSRYQPWSDSNSPHYGDAEHFVRRVLDYAATLKAAQGGVTGAMRTALSKLVEAAVLMLAEIDTCGHEVDPAYRLCLYTAWEQGKAALSAEPAAQGEAGLLPPSITLPSLIEAARCLGCAQEKGDADAIRYWNGQVEHYAAVASLAATPAAPAEEGDGKEGENEDPPTCPICDQMKLSARCPACGYEDAPTGAAR